MSECEARGLVQYQVNSEVIEIIWFEDSPSACECMNILVLVLAQPQCLWSWENLKQSVLQVKACEARQAPEDDAEIQALGCLVFVTSDLGTSDTGLQAPRHFWVSRAVGSQRKSCSWTHTSHKLLCWTAWCVFRLPQKHHAQGWRHICVKIVFVFLSRLTPRCGWSKARHNTKHYCFV